jgi:peptidoglycan/xylan/chitin deacetylase (PgdA/CDA1 family)
MYWFKTPKFFKKIYRKCVWNISFPNNTVYITFDDGPIPEITLWVLEVLRENQVKATFFCVGENINKHPEIYKQVLLEGHSVGNHTYNHNNGWKTNDKVYESSVEKAQTEMDLYQSNQVKLFRPPYGKLKWNQYQRLLKNGYKIIMWEVLSADFDTSLDPETCLEKLKKNTAPGSIIVFHDNVKSFRILKKVLPEYLMFLKQKGLETAVIC